MILIWLWLIFVKSLAVRKHNLKVKPKKCVLFQEEVEYLGCLVSKHGVTLRPDNVKIIREWPVPSTKKELQSFLGFTDYHREFIKDYSVVVEDLQMLVTKSKAGPIQLAKCHLDVIQILKEKLSNAPILSKSGVHIHNRLQC